MFFVHFKNLIFFPRVHYTIRKTDILYSRKHIKILFTQRITNRMNLYMWMAETIYVIWLLQLGIMEHLSLWGVTYTTHTHNSLS